MKSALIRAAVLMAAIAIATGSAAAAVPGTMNYQGKLADNAGQPVRDGDYELTFAIFTGPLERTPVWQEGPRTVQVEGGLFTVLLGQSNPLTPGVLDGDRWLQVAVEGTVLEPRVQLASAPFSFRAGLADDVADSAAVKSLNSLTGDVTLAAGDNIAISTSGNTVTVEGLSIPNPLPVTVENTPTVALTTQGKLVPLWDEDQTVVPNAVLSSPILDCRGYQQIRMVITTTGEYSNMENIEILIYFKPPNSSAYSLLGVANMGTPEVGLTPNANFQQVPNRAYLSVPVVSETMWIRIRNKRTGNITISKGSWVYMLN